jgi:hypothetical protein
VFLVLLFIDDNFWPKEKPPMIRAVKPKSFQKKDHLIKDDHLLKKPSIIDATMTPRSDVQFVGNNLFQSDR